MCAKKYILKEIWTILHSARGLGYNKINFSGIILLMAGFTYLFKPQLLMLPNNFGLIQRVGSLAPRVVEINHG